MQKKINAIGDGLRILIAAPKSGSGKTMITCGIIEAFKRRKLNIGAIKCGPDYIDPMFHRRVLGVETGNLDTFFTDEETTKNLLARKLQGKDLTIIEGVMGYYDGIRGNSSISSTYELAGITGTPVILVVDAKGASVTLAALIKGIIEYRSDSNICGVILNRVAPSYYERLKGVIERECKVSVLGFVPNIKDLEIPSRHLGLVSPEEMERLHRSWINIVADEIEAHVKLDDVFSIAKGAERLLPDDDCAICGKILCKDCETVGLDYDKPVSIAVARDEAFSFFYTENIELLERLGARIIYFSPLHDSHLPEDIGGIILGGGYPENYAKELSDNASMRKAIKEAVSGGLNCLAECGGFMYLQNTMEGADGQSYEMTGVLNGNAFRTDRLCRFGYIEIGNEQQNDGIRGNHDNKLIGTLCGLRGHEFHYWDCTDNGDAIEALKPSVVIRDEKEILTCGKGAGDNYRCMVHTENILAGFPHFYYYSNPKVIAQFLNKCSGYIKRLNNPEM